MSTVTQDTVTAYDPVLAEVIRRRLEVVCEESAITLKRTSGSPILSEANDFGTALASPEGEIVALSSYTTPHFVSTMNAMRSVLATVDPDSLRPGDHFAANDPTTVAPLHAADPVVISPIFSGGQVAAWACCSVHVIDIGGLSAGGWIPGAYDRFGEGFMFPLTKVVSEGQWDETFVSLYLANVRMPESLSDLRSCVAANNTAASRLEEVFERYGVETVRQYVDVNIELSEKRVRERIGSLRDGTYTSTDWVEYDGHGTDTLWRLSVKLTVRGDEILIDVSDSPPEADCFVNATRSALLGLMFSDFCRSLCPDVPLNAGLTRPLRLVRSEPGTMLNPSAFAATSAGHMESGTRVLKQFHRALHKAIGLSESPDVWGRSAGLGGNVAGHNVVAGINDAGFPEVWVSFDSIGTGYGAQITGDGHIGAYEDVHGLRMLDIEMEEEASTLHFYRRLCPNSGGHGFRRGGLGIDSAWQLHGMSAGQLTTMSNNSRVPAAAPGGGYPGGGTGNRLFAGGIGEGTPTELSKHLTSPEMRGEGKLLPSHGTNLAFSGADVLNTFGAGGSGLGDPLFREPWRVLEDLESDLITGDVAGDVYGVVVDAAGAVDETATAQRRREIRAERLGGEPRREPAPMLEYRPALRIEDGQFRCGHCKEQIASVEENWKESARGRFWPLSDRAQFLGTNVRPTGARSLVLWEFSCPSCGSLIETDIAEADESLPHDVRIGETVGEPGEPF